MEEMSITAIGRFFLDIVGHILVDSLRGIVKTKKPKQEQETKEKGKENGNQ